ncbi:sigma 54-interacting transcriptional regulator [Salipaludibacillus daqingensis]|uniref:sigma 54-interacting transcriptional regulator n=1 Tax=Salipaludibacillus daqingensis TaxID=3041001 RepID=UPI0024770531|nr:sigma 54-interacting transcriptional regulator [Salipaludibacillus daqingensis]
MKKVTVNVRKKNGLHIRLAASLISTLQNHIDDPEKLRDLWIEYRGQKAQISNLLSIVSLKIPENGSFEMYYDRENELEFEKFVDVVTEFFADMSAEEVTEELADQLLLESSVSIQDAISSMSHGVMVVNRNNIITYVNQAASELIGKSAHELIHHSAKELIPSSKIHQVLKTGKQHLSEKQHIAGRVMITNRSPIFFDNEIIGAVATFEDISNIEKISSELEMVQLLKERLNLVLETVFDFIGMTDSKGTFIYKNEAFKRFLIKEDLPDHIFSFINKEEWHILQEEGETISTTFENRKGSFYIVRAQTLSLEKGFKGIVISFSPYREMEELLKELSSNKTFPGQNSPDNNIFPEIIGQSENLQNTLSMAVRVANTNSTVMITGESGTGKELVARGIHEKSDRRKKPFISVNCASIPATILESELFGHEKGSFTGAVRMHTGKFEQANGGTIFLDEIGDLQLDIQGKVLRVLQERELVRIGGKETISLDIRVISATNKNLFEMVQEGIFREDLYYRLHVIPIHLPPLRDRKRDVWMLIDYFLNYYSKIFKRKYISMSRECYEKLQAYHWPGNIRELKNVMERIVSLAQSERIGISDLPEYIYERLEQTEQTIERPQVKTLDEYEFDLFSQVAPLFNSYNQLGKALGITHKTAAKKLRKYNLEHKLGNKYQKN